MAFLESNDNLTFFACLCLTFQGCKQSFNRVKEELMQLSNVDSPSCSNSITSQNQMGPQNMEAAESPISGHISEYEDTESGIAVSLSSFCIIYSKYRLTDADSIMHLLSVYLKRNSVQQIIAEQAPDTTLSLRCSSLWMES